MDLNELKYIIAVSKHKNITKAAESLFISQPSLSRFLINLEERLGIKLFDKIGRTFKLTYAGEVYVDYAYRILSLKEQLDQELKDLMHDKKGRLHIAFSRIRGSHVLPNVLPKFLEEFPNFDLKITEAQSADIERMLVQGEVEIAIMNQPIRHPDIQFIQIQKEHLLVVTSIDHPLAKHAKLNDELKYPWIDLSLFKNESFVLTDHSQRTRELADYALGEYGINPNVILTTENLETSIKLAASSVGVCFTPESFIKFMYFPIQPKYFAVGDPPIFSNLAAAYRKGTYLSKPAKRFIDIYKNAI